MVKYCQHIQVNRSVVTVTNFNPLFRITATARILKELHCYCLTNLTYPTGPGCLLVLNFLAIWYALATRASIDLQMGMALGGEGWISPYVVIHHMYKYSLHHLLQSDCMAILQNIKKICRDCSVALWDN